MDEKQDEVKNGGVATHETNSKNIPAKLSESFEQMPAYEDLVADLHQHGVQSDPKIIKDKTQILKNQHEQHILWITKMERKFRERKDRPVSKMTSEQLIAELGRTDRAIKSFDEAIRQLESQNKELDLCTPICTAPSVNNSMHQNQLQTPNSEEASGGNTQDSASGSSSCIDVLDNLYESHTVNSATSDEASSTPEDRYQFMNKLRMERRIKERRMRKLLNECKSAQSLNRKRPFTKTFTVFKEQDSLQEIEAAASTHLRSISSCESETASRHCMFCDTSLPDKVKVQEHFAQEKMENEDILQILAWESKTRWSFLGVFLGIYHKHFKSASTNSVHCYFCGDKMVSCSEIIDHFRFNHLFAFSSKCLELVARCFVCWARIHTLDILENHYKSIHKIEGNQLQTYMRCNYYGDMWEKLIADMEGQIIYCRLCDFKCAQREKSLFIRHVRQDHEKSTVDCTECKECLDNCVVGATEHTV